jgi:hypothetical protein
MDDYFREEWTTKHMHIFSQSLQQTMELKNATVFNHMTNPLLEIPYDKFVQIINGRQIPVTEGYKIELIIFAMNSTPNWSVLLSSNPEERILFIIVSKSSEINCNVHDIYRTCDSFVNCMYNRYNIICGSCMDYIQKYAIGNGYCNECDNYIETKTMQLILTTICEQQNDFANYASNTPKDGQPSRLHICWNITEKVFADIFLARTISNY